MDIRLDKRGKQVMLASSRRKFLRRTSQEGKSALASQISNSSFYSQGLGHLGHLTCYNVQFVGLSMFGSRDDQHQKKGLNWLLIVIKPILKVIDQLLKSIHGHTYRAARAAEKLS